MTTNTLHLVSTSGVDLETLRAAAQQCGEVASFSVVPGEVDLVEISFYDVRAALQAQKAFAALYCECSFGPQVGDRRVDISGAVPVEARYMDAISGIYHRGTWDTCYVVEFYDVRDAAAFRRTHTRTSDPGCPPVESLNRDSQHVDDYDDAVHELSMPPGLARVHAEDLIAPPGLPCRLNSNKGCLKAQKTSHPRFNLESNGIGEDVNPMSMHVPVPALHNHPMVPEEMYQVRIVGLDANLLRYDMLETIFEQAGLEDLVVSCTVVDMFVGEVRVVFSNLHAAAWFVVHVRNCCWARHSKLFAEMCPGIMGTSSKSSVHNVSSSGSLRHTPSLESLMSEPMLLKAPGVGSVKSKKVNGDICTSFDTNTPAYVQVPRLAEISSDMSPANSSLTRERNPASKTASCASTEFNETVSSELEV